MSETVKFQPSDYALFAYNLESLILSIPEGKQIHLFKGDLPSVMSDFLYRRGGSQLVTGPIPKTIDSRQTIRSTIAGKVTTTWTVWMFQLDDHNVYIYRPTPSELRTYEGRKASEVTEIAGSYSAPANMRQILRLVVCHTRENKMSDFSTYILEHKMHFSDRDITSRYNVQEFNPLLLATSHRMKAA